MSKHILLIMRHAKSDWSANVEDIDRPLNKRGHKDAKKMGKWLRRSGFIPDRIVCSPAYRTMQTIRIVCEQLDRDTDDIIQDDRIYETGLHDLLQAVREHGKNAACLLLAGHNPGLDNLVGYLAKDMPLRSASGKLMSTAAVAVLEFDADGIDDRRKSAQLLQIARPKEI